jgi:hypothetical protein
MTTRIAFLNRTDNMQELARLLHLCYHQCGMTYKEAFEHFQRADPTIDRERFEEISATLDDLST